MNRLNRVLATAAATAALATGGAALAQAQTFNYVPVGGQVCVYKYNVPRVDFQGSSDPQQARFELRRNGVLVVGPLTTTDLAGSAEGYGNYTFCGKNKLGNTGPINITLNLW